MCLRHMTRFHGAATRHGRALRVARNTVTDKRKEHTEPCSRSMHLGLRGATAQYIRPMSATGTHCREFSASFLSAPVARPKKPTCSYESSACFVTAVHVEPVELEGPSLVVHLCGLAPARRRACVQVELPVDEAHQLEPTTL